MAQLYVRNLDWANLVHQKPRLEGIQAWKDFHGLIFTDHQFI